MSADPPGPQRGGDAEAAAAADELHATDLPSSGGERTRPREPDADSAPETPERTPKRTRVEETKDPAYESALRAIEEGDNAALETLPQELLCKCIGVPEGVLLVHAAAKSGNAEAIAALARLGAGGTFAAKTHDGETATDLAVRFNRSDCLRAIAAAGAVATFVFARVGEAGEDQTPIHAAAKRGHVECLRVFLDILPERDFVASLCAGDAAGNTPGILAALSKDRGAPECLELIGRVSPRALAKPGGAANAPPACYAAKEGNSKCLKVIATCADRTLLFEMGDGRTPVLLAAAQGHKECLDVIQDVLPEHEFVASLRATDSRGNTPAILAACIEDDGGSDCLELIGFASPEALAKPGGATNAPPAYYAAKEGNSECLKVIATLAGDGLLSKMDNGRTLVHTAAALGQTDCLQVIKDVLPESEFVASVCDTDSQGNTPAILAALCTDDVASDCLKLIGETSGLSPAFKLSGGPDKATPACYAAEAGNIKCLEVIIEYAADTLLSTNKDGDTPAILAADMGHYGCLDILAADGRTEVLTTPNSSDGTLPAHCAAVNNHSHCLDVIVRRGAAETFAAVTIANMTAAILAADKGCDECLEIIATHGPTEAITTAGGEAGAPPAHYAADKGHDKCLEVLAKHAAAHETFVMRDRDGETAVTLAASKGFAKCLSVITDVIVEHGDISALTKSSRARNGSAVHMAAYKGSIDCLRALHAGVKKVAEQDEAIIKAAPGLQQLRMLPSVETWTATLTKCARLEMGLDVTNLISDVHRIWLEDSDMLNQALTPAEVAAIAGKLMAVQFFVNIGGARRLHQRLAAKPSLLFREPFNALLSAPTLLNLECKKAWLRRRMRSVVRSQEPLSIVMRDNSVLEGLCDAFGVSEHSGELREQLPRDIRVRAEGGYGGDDRAAGTGVRRGWFIAASNEIADVDKGLFTFTSRDNKTVQPNPDSEALAGRDHLSHFALFGQIAALAMYYGDSLGVQLSPAFIKAVLGMSVSVTDLREVDPDLFVSKVEELGRFSAEELAALELTFEDDVSGPVMGAQASVPLKEGGADVAVTNDNLEEYLQLWVERRLVGSVREQIDAFRRGFAVYVDSSLQDELRRLFQPAELQRLLCGVKEIDVGEWRRESSYDNGLCENAPIVKWFWALVEGKMSPDERAALLQFCTGSPCVPVGGFSQLLENTGIVRKFTLSHEDVDTERLPRAYACFNTMYLPPYPSAEMLEVKLRQAILGTTGFAD